MSLHAKFYYALRVYLHKKRWLLRLVQILRACVVLGPLRKPLVLYYQKFSHNEPLKTDSHPIFPNLDADQLAKMIHEVGYAPIGTLPEEYVNQILDYCAINKQVSYWNPHKDCEAVNHICRNDKIVEIARKYLGAEPILWLTQLRWSFPFSDDLSDFRRSIYREPSEYDAHCFHYDTIDFKSLTLFIYLTDIDSYSGAHVIIEGTHDKKIFKEIRTRILDEDVANKKFGDRITVILGKKGTAFVEETSTYHKVASCKSRRLILSVDYVLQRKVPPERPALVDSQAT